MIFLWLENNWKLVLAVLLIGGTFFTGYQTGATIERVAYQALMQAEHNDAEKRRQDLQAAADRAAVSYEKARAKTNAAMIIIERKLANAQKNNLAFGTCHAGTEWLQLYSDTAGAGAGR